MTIEPHSIEVSERTMPAFVEAVVQKALDGYVVDTVTNPGDTNIFGNVFSVAMYRDNSTVEKLRSTIGNVSEKPKMSRAETLAVARDAKRLKARGAVLDECTVQKS
jgi:hypothetical protein